VFDVILAAAQSGEASMNAESFLKQLHGGAAEKTGDRVRFDAWIRQRSGVFESSALRKLATWVPHVSRYSFQAAPVDLGRKARATRKAKR
jgi:hypothetical protein